MFETENLLSQLNTGGGRRLNNKLEDWTIEVIKYEEKREKILEENDKPVDKSKPSIMHNWSSKRKETESGTENCEEIIGGNLQT